MIILRKIAYIMIGIPGSGKSTWIKNNLPRNINIISKDQIRINLGIMGKTRKAIGTKEEEERVQRIYESLLSEALNSGKSFVIDNVNLGKNLSKLMEYIKNYGYYIVGVRINTPLKVCIKRRPEIPRNILIDMHEKLDQINPRIFNKFINYDNT